MRKCCWIMTYYVTVLVAGLTCGIIYQSLSGPELPTLLPSTVSIKVSKKEDPFEAMVHVNPAAISVKSNVKAAMHGIRIPSFTESGVRKSELYINEVIFPDEVGEHIKLVDPVIVWFAEDGKRVVRSIGADHGEVIMNPFSTGASILESIRMWGNLKGQSYPETRPKEVD